jgi:5-methylcytosine-specific restriction endonuclease McrA
MDMLDRQVLVLNRHWVAIHLCTVRRALTLLFQEMALVVNEDLQTHDFNSWRELSEFADSTGPLIHAPGFVVIPPRVIVLAEYQRCPPRTVRFNRRNIFMRDQYTCQYCGHKPKDDDLTIDHIIPKSRGGRTVWENVVLSCTRCNMKKSDRLPHECGMSLRRPPKRPSWIGTLAALHLDEDNRSLWQKFVDTAYWETNLYE